MGGPIEAFACAESLGTQATSSIRFRLFRNRKLSFWLLEGSVAMYCADSHRPAKDLDRDMVPTSTVEIETDEASIITTDLKD